MKTIVGALALLLWLASPAAAQWHGGYHGGWGYPGYHGYHGYHRYYGGPFTPAYGYHRHFHRGEYWRGGVLYMCSPWQYEAGMCGVLE